MKSGYSGSRFNGEPHGFGRSEQPDFTHTGWFENGKAFGFGTRFYKNGSIDVGHWEVDSLVQVAKFYPNGLKTQMEFLFGPGTKAFKTQVVNLTGVLRVPKIRLKALNLPSKRSEIVATPSDLHEMKLLQGSNKEEISKYRSIDSDVTVSSDELQTVNRKFLKQQSDIIENIIQLEKNEIIQDFWTKITKENSIDSEIEISDDINILHEHLPQGDQTQKIFQAFEAIENFNLRNFLKLVRDGVHVCSRDITGFSLLHCSVIFNNVKIVSSLVNSGSLGVTCFHMTPLNLALMLHFLPRLKRKIELCREDYEQPLFIKTNRSQSDMDSAYGSASIFTNSTDDYTSSIRPGSAMTRQTTPKKERRPHTATARISSARKERVRQPVISRPVSSSGPVLSDYRRIISQMVSAGITNVPQTCDYTVPELFWPVLAQDDNLAVKMLLAGVNVEQSMLVSGMKIEPIHLSTETSATIVAALVAARGNADKPVEKVKNFEPEKVKFRFVLQETDDSNALFRCNRSGAIEQSTALILGGANVDTNDANGYTPLGIAILSGHFDLVKRLLELGLNPSQPQRAGGTPIGLVLHPKTDSLFTLPQKVALIDMLVKYGARIYEKCSITQNQELHSNTIDYVDRQFHPPNSPPPMAGFFSSLKEDEKRNYLARGELQLYITTIIREQLANLAREKDPKAITACFECGKAKKKLTVDSYFKVIAFCSAQCRKKYWMANPSRSEIKAKKRKAFNFEPFYMQKDLEENYSFN